MSFMGKLACVACSISAGDFFHSCIDFLLFFVGLLVSRPETGPMD